MELGIYTFGDLVADPHTGMAVSAQERMRQMLELFATKVAPVVRKETAA